MTKQSDKATVQHKQVSQQIKPFLNLGKIVGKYGNPVVIQGDKLLIYKFCDGNFYSEFNISYPSFGYHIENNIPYDLFKIDSNDSQSVFYTDNVVNKIERMFNEKHCYSNLVFRTNLLLSSVKEIISENKKIEIMVCTFSDYDNLKTLTLKPWFKSPYSFYDYTFNGLFTESIEDSETKIKPKYLELALSHGYKYSKIYMGKLNTPIYIYGDDNEHFDVPKFRCVIMNMYTNDESNQELAKKLNQVMELRHGLRTQ